MNTIKYLLLHWMSDQCSICEQGTIIIKKDATTGLVFKSCNSCGSEYGDKETMSAYKTLKNNLSKKTK